MSNSSASSTLNIEAFQHRFDALEQSSRHFLVTHSTHTHDYRSELQDLMEQWNEFLKDFHQTTAANQRGRGLEKEKNQQELVKAATDRLHDIYTAWKGQQSSQPSPTASILSFGSKHAADPHDADDKQHAPNRPYQILLRAFSEYSVSGPHALSILQDWDEALAGDMEWAAQDSDYARVLQAYADDHQHDHAEPSSGWRTRALEAVEVAREIVQRLEQSYTSSPSPQTYQRLVRCVARVILSTESDLDDGRDDSNHHRHHPRNLREHYFPFLEQAMDKLLQLPTLDARNVKEDDEEEKDEPFWTLALALGDAIQAWESVQKQNPNDAGAFSVRRKEWLTHWGRILLPENADLWRRWSSNHDMTMRLEFLERTTMSVLMLYQRVLLRELEQGGTMSPDDLLGYLEAMSQFALQLDDLEAMANSRRPLGHHFNCAIQEWGRFRKHVSAEKYRTLAKQQQEFLLERLQKSHERGLSTTDRNDDPALATQSFNNLIQACLDAGCPGRVKELWDKKINKPPSVRKNEQSFTILLQSLAAKREPDTPMEARIRAQNAHAILSRMVTYDRSRRLYHPTSTQFASVMIAWSRSYHVEAALHCHNVMEMMWEENRHTNDDSLIPSSAHYNALVTTWGFSRLPGSFKQVVRLYEEMKRAGFRLNLSSYTSVLFALARCRNVESARTAQKILTEMEDNRDLLRPTLACYNSVILAWSNSGDRDAPRHCQDVYQRLLTAFEHFERDPALRPDATTYCGLIDVFLHENSAPSKNMIAAGDRAEAILAEMEERASQGLAEAPDAKVFTAVMKAHWKGDQPDATARVEAVLKRMKEAYEAGNKSAKPDVQAMTVLLQTWAKSRHPNKATIAWGILSEMQKAFEHGDLDMRPNSYSYAALLNACAYTKAEDRETKNQAVKIALMVLKELGSPENGSGGELNEFLFRGLFQTIFNQVDNIKERTECAGVIFQQCCQAGFVNRPIILAVQKQVPALYKRLPTGPDRQLQLPHHWTRHAST